MKKIIKANVQAMQYLETEFPKLGRMKIHEGIFVGPQIRNFLYSDEFRMLLTVRINGRLGYHLKQLLQVSSETSQIQIINKLSTICCKNMGE